MEKIERKSLQTYPWELGERAGETLKKRNFREVAVPWVEFQLFTSCFSVI